jgi:DNA-binding PadR family transcriptional regulator
MALKTSGYLVLGLVRGGVSSGYAIRRFVAQQRMSVFWATTLAQIYPELAQLEDDGYLLHREAPHGARARRAYSLTDKGERAFLAWLRRTRVPAMELRDEGLLRLAFADHLPPPEALALVRRLRARSEETEREFREQILPVAQTLRAAGLRFPIVIAEMGAQYHAWAVTHLVELEARLTAELEGG